jgi:hypothetical protein
VTRLDDSEALELVWRQPRMTERYEEAAAALGEAGALWTGLASDDDATVADILTPDWRLHLSALPGGWAERLRGALRVTRAECESLGCSATIRVSRSGSLVVFGIFRRPQLGIYLLDKTGPERGVPVVFVPIDGRWHASGAYDEHEPGLDIIGLVDVIPHGGGSDA